MRIKVAKIGVRHRPHISGKMGISQTKYCGERILLVAIVVASVSKA
jgi:hypothetical protein